MVGIVDAESGWYAPILSQEFSHLLAYVLRIQPPCIYLSKIKAVLKLEGKIYELQRGTGYLAANGRRVYDTQRSAG